MKFKRPEKYNKWTIDQTNEQIDFIMGEVKAFNQELNKIESHMNELKNQKRIISNKVSNKTKYINQLKRQLLEIENEEEWKEL